MDPCSSRGIPGSSVKGRTSPNRLSQAKPTFRGKAERVQKWRARKNVEETPQIRLFDRPNAIRLVRLRSHAFPIPLQKTRETLKHL